MTLGVGILGFGVMGRVHAASWDAARRAGLPVRLVGVHSRSLAVAGAVDNLDALAGELTFDLSSLTLHATVDDLLSDDRIDAVSICTHTDTHVTLALRALAAGKHVLVEKPVALSAAEIAPLAAAAARAATACMPAMCMRFWPGWPWLRGRIRTGEFGRVLSARFERAGPPPGWGRHFYADLGRSGGAFHDLHVHDADFVLWCFGEPSGIRAEGDLEAVRAAYAFDDDGPRVTAEAAWLRTPGAAFRMRYRVDFEGGTVDFAHDRDPVLQFTRGVRTEPIPIPFVSAYDAEVRHFAEVALGRSSPIIGIEDALAVAALLDREKASLSGSE